MRAKIIAIPLGRKKFVTSSAVQFIALGTKLCLIYSPRDGASWIHERFARGDALDIKGTFHLTKADLLEKTEPNNLNDVDYDDSEISFVVAQAEGKYFVFNPAIIQIKVPVLIARGSNPTWKWFTAEEKVSVLKLLADLKPSRIVIGGDASDAIPINEYEKLIAQFPTAYELKYYIKSRLSIVFREFSDAKIDANALLHNYVAKRITSDPKDPIQPFRKVEALKYEYLLKKLRSMLKKDVGYTERHWQKEILGILQLLNPKYVACFTSVIIKDTLTGGNRQVDIMLVDANGNIDVVEIKKPFKAKIVTEGTYRNNHVPHHELSGAVTQVEKYLFHLNRWGNQGEDKLTERFKEHLPVGLKIRIVNPCGLVIMGRDNDLTNQQMADFEIFRRQNKNIVDVVTYDDLVRRLERVLNHFKAKADLQDPEWNDPVKEQ
ncbi:Shedu immune nuclease family protein [Mesoterricola sediminis]|uniref:Shedu protein SduA C-terminal domain-containing protein n=1 Tax=Mesoterricola sediminis TaxID=2927980 RepID=A0AA48KDV2_9BACT|nr:Shedu immune nuclease family protein [Mesoterricola sediminis]BDU77435.1 hypothetical protein METESE_23930 [Mesoterricola sediminis]